MKRFVASLLLAGAVVLLMLVPLAGLSTNSSLDPTPEYARITDYAATFDVDDQGTLTATETLTVDLPLGRHGIFRFFDTADVYEPHVRYVPHDIEVTRDGDAEPVEVSRESGGRYLNVRIGSPDVTLDGSHVYRISYRVDGVLGAEGDASQFYWNLVPAGWRMPIERSRLEVSLPGEVGDLRCAVGVGSSGGCDAETSGDGFTVTTGALRPHTPVTVQAPVAVPPPGQTTVPWTWQWDPVLGRSPVLAAIVAVIAVVGLVVGWLIGRSVREPEPPFPLQYAPPDGLGPAQAAYLLTERVNDDMYAATMLDLAAKGVVDLDRGGHGWTIARADGDLGQVDEVGQITAANLGVQQGSFELDPDDPGAGQVIKSARSGFTTTVKGWARTNGLMEFKALPALGSTLMVLSAVVAVALFVWNPFSMSLLGLPFGWFASQLWPVVTPGATTMRTRAGRDQWSRIGGFRRVLATPSSEARFDFSGRKELYTAYIPWAVAFGVADAWARKYQFETGEEPPVPTYLGGFYPGGYYGSPVNAFTNDFNASMQSAISSYEATLAPQSSGGGGGFGGGGFSGGGGGGGGGGGSW